MRAHFFLAGCLFASPVVLAFAGTEGKARADEAGGATAEVLFQKGKAALAAGQTAEACKFLDESYRLDKAGGTLQNLAFCYETLGRFATAYALYEDLRAKSLVATPPRPDRVQLADEHIKKLAPMLTRLYVRVSPDVRARGMELRVDGVTYGEVAWSAGIVLDPGKHAVDVRAPGKIAFTKEIAISERGDETLAVPRLEDDKAKLADPHPTRKAGVIVGAIGTTIAVGGGVFAILAAGSKNACHGTGPDFDPATGLCYRGSNAFNKASSDENRASTFANVANVAVPLGLVGLGVGAYLFFRGPGEKSGVSARLEPSPFGARVVGEF